jgi:putative NADH-flavin reductase
MKIALVAATGNIGRHIAARALQRGHQVTAIVRSARTLSPELAGAKLAVAALDDADTLAAAVRGHDVLASAYGPGAADAGTIVAATRQLIDAARASGVRRLIVVGGAGSLEVAPGVQLVDAPTFPAPYKPYALAHREALGLLRAATDLDWTFYAPAAEIGPGEAVGTFRTGVAALIVGSDGHSRISYPDYAQAFVDEIETPRFTKQIATVAY